MSKPAPVQNGFMLIVTIPHKMCLGPFHDPVSASAYQTAYLEKYLATNKSAAPFNLYAEIVPYFPVHQAH